MSGRLLIVDDEMMKRRALCLEARKRGFEAEEASNAAEGMEKLREAHFDVVVTDLRMPGMDGHEFLRRIRQFSSEISVVIITAYGTVASAVEAMREGAQDYLLKPFSAEEFFLRLERLMAYREALALNRILLSQEGDGPFQHMIGRSPAMQKVFRLIARSAQLSGTVLVTGESGTGKELVADALHALSKRSKGPLIKVSCAILARDVMESELFGHVRGAFTGALRDRQGRFEAASGGTLFLDDVDDIPPEVQVKLLRVLQAREVERVGGDAPISVDVRLVAATKADLGEMVRAGRFREDLYYRLNVLPIRLPPLRQRREDIPLLVRHFMERFEHSAAQKLRGVDERALRALLAYDWPGNVRELENAMERAVGFADTDQITLPDLPETLHAVAPAEGVVRLDLAGQEAVDLRAELARVERRLVRWALARSGNSQRGAAMRLNVPRSTLRDRMSRLGLKGEEVDEIPSAPDGDPSSA